MKTFFLILSAAITIGSIIPYLRDILRGRTKPNLVSWLTWTLLTSIATSAQLSTGELVGAAYTSIAALTTGLVVAMGLYMRSYVRYTPFDIVCQISALVGVLLWQFFDSAVIGVAASVTIDFIGALPTVRHAWQKPGEETWQTFALSGVGAVFGLLALDAFTAVNLPYPVYIIVINTVITAVVLGRRRHAG